MIDWQMEVELIASHFLLYYFRQIGKSWWGVGCFWVNWPEPVT